MPKKPVSKRKSASAAQIKRALKEYINPEKAAFFPRFFKAGKGEYAEGDKFLGVTVPNQRKIAKQFRDVPIDVVEKLLDDAYHECRLTALLILVEKFQRAKTQEDRKIVFDLYVKKMDQVNNWDLVDSSAHKIVGPYLEESGDDKLLDRLAESGHLWRQRIAIIATLHFIKQNEFDHTIRIGEMLLDHPHDLIHKAVGWMIREMGNRDKNALTCFLQSNEYETMPRTMLRYAIEKLPEKERKAYLSGEA